MIDKFYTFEYIKNKQDISYAVSYIIDSYKIHYPKKSD